MENNNKISILKLSQKFNESNLKFFSFENTSGLPVLVSLIYVGILKKDINLLEENLLFELGRKYM